MKLRLLIPIAIIILLIGCDTKQLYGPALDENIVEEVKVIECTSIQDLAKIARQLEANIPKEVLSGQTRTESFMTTHDSEEIAETSEKIAEILDPLKRVGLSVRNQMFNDSRLSIVDSKNLSNLTEQELVFIGILNTILENNGQTKNGNFQTTGYPNTMAASSLGSCVASALGLKALENIIKSNGAANADDVLKAAKKLGKRTLGWVGAAIIVYELATCLNDE